ncbi:NUDIX hydrolase domain-like protein [Dunaliella salina]|uniref:NUDIX hydrolase domain-like protein n=1 Tax=Dunaliella salina TaxID=3046 RepID=A0ABQ7GRF2_DUNSA|nr:NUDIX hydrolase domain-like protein [Dunaliella salina]|eukprot:KAF5837187.1 NUDIX hydrolase domain-like protein [Dunaliella salina]
MGFQHHVFKIGGGLHGVLASEESAIFKEWNIIAGQKAVNDILCKLEEAADNASLLTAAFVVADSSAECEQLNLLHELRQAFPSMFIVLWHPNATEDARMRTKAFAAGANMVSNSWEDWHAALALLAKHKGGGSVRCDWCGLQGLTPSDMWIHQPLYHIYQPSREGKCQICCLEDVPNMAVHIHEMHDPRGPHPEVRTGAGSAVIVHRQQDNKFLMVQEFAGQGFWVPGGGNDPNERLSVCGVRECFEETGIRVVLKGLLEVAYRDTPRPWRLAVFYAVPEEEDVESRICHDQSIENGGHARAPQVPKTLPCFESAGACWVSADDLPHIPIRNPSVIPWYQRITSGNFELLPLDAWPANVQEVFAGLEI